MVGRYGVKRTRECAYEGCTNTVTEDDYCSGCGSYICIEHDGPRYVDPPEDEHDPEDHWEE